MYGDLAVSTLDSVRIALSAPFDLPLASLDRLPNGRYYVVVSATLKPLSVEDVEEGEGWLSGEVEEKRRSGPLGVLTAIPHSLFDAVRNFAGLGDQRARSITDEFTLDELPER